MSDTRWNVLVTGGAGYVGSVLVPQLLDAGHSVTVLDLYLYGDGVLDAVKDHPGLRQIKGDLRDLAVVEDALTGRDAVIHLACISNDPSFELDPELGKSINLDAFRPLVQAAKKAGVKRFIYASSSSVYGIKDDPEVHEDLALEPLTEYSKFKIRCEEILNEERGDGFVGCTIRPSTVCGYGPRQRLDVIVNILTNHAVTNGRIRVFGGSQKRPNLHIEDMVGVYLYLLQQPGDKIDGKIWNAGYQNHTLLELAEIVKRVVGGDLEIVIEPTDDMRSYHVSSAKITRDIGFVPRHTIEDAVRDLVAAFAAGKLPDSMSDVKYSNIQTMQSLNLK